MHIPRRLAHRKPRHARGVDARGVVCNLKVTVTCGLPTMKARAARSDLALDALGSPIRREIVRLLGEKPRAVGELAEELPVSRPAVSKHLRLLEGAGLVTRAARGTRNVCQLEQTGFEAARAWLEAFWDEGLARFRLLAENTLPQDGASHPGRWRSRSLHPRRRQRG
jgi:DNA-binding transcriptional ArsR family regulator